MSSSINSAVDAVTEGINGVGILDSEVQICANCANEGNDVTNTCNKCKMVMYCNAACKKKHRHKHKKNCEEHLKRAAENVAKEHDEQLFKQPPQPEDDCSICFLRTPSLHTGRTYMACCGKMMCTGCIHAVQSRAALSGRIDEDNICPFCRLPNPASKEEIIERYEKRVGLIDPTAIFNLGGFYANGLYGLRQNRAKALELWHRAGELGCTESYDNIGYAYRFGRGVELDFKKAMHYYELAAINGCTEARNSLGLYEDEAGNMDRALKHYLIAARDGNALSLKNIKNMYKGGRATKADFAKALRSYQAYLDEIKSDQRDEAFASNGRYKYYESTF